MLDNKHLLLFGRETISHSTRIRREERASSRQARPPATKIRATNLTWIGEYATLYQIHQAY